MPDCSQEIQKTLEERAALVIQPLAKGWLTRKVYLEIFAARRRNAKRMWASLYITQFIKAYLKRHGLTPMRCLQNRFAGLAKLIRETKRARALDYFSGHAKRWIQRRWGHRNLPKAQVCTSAWVG